MRGFSVYLYDELQIDYMINMKNSGFDRVFTSLHIPEYDLASSWQVFQQLIALCKDLKLQLMVDVSREIMEKLPMSADELSDLGVRGLRLDDGFSIMEIAQYCKRFQVALNASTITVDMVRELQDLKVNFSHIEAWHNYYPRRNTGLDAFFLLNQNTFLHEVHVKVVAFVMGDQQLRGPMYEGLPTLEKHRNSAVFANALELINRYSVDEIMIGDPSISRKAMRQFESYYSEKVMMLTVAFNGDYVPITHCVFTSRPEIARDVIRLQESRSLFYNHQFTGTVCERKIGDITINSQELLRYSGEINLVKQHIPLDAFVLKIGRIIEEDIPLLSLCEGQQKIILTEVTEWI
ncbi:MupG family TIM beta-alpha barrel fold protein [Kurthia sibirica]|uniref:DUF871 domain-containing protein n=1 Tax=Kurthia sibirica TaxID=202750 RepID=A0A2U3ANV6_9BACL|nr:MupG family TIM beta-alpha barrel fold protein [Kurthia sibirica]PWI26125.1 DUF871 domain-containing protein [Kurthia sibirica]GEK33382.1 hypothetical protein KSI01_09150 [Kurthia sibirica]